MKAPAALLPGILCLAFLAGPAGGAQAQTASIKAAHSFSAYNTEGFEPYSALVQAKDGNFYGTTPVGGANEYGACFKMTPAGVVTYFYSFSAFDSHFINGTGALPQAGLVQGADGNFYGLTNYGGPTGYGVFFRVTAAGVLTALHNFDSEDGAGINKDGATPIVSLIVGKDGNFYGTTVQGGSGASGTVFKVTPAGTFTTLHSFAALDFELHNTDGAQANGGMIQASDGNFYGTALAGGANGNGVVYKLTAAGVMTTIYTFPGFGSDGFSNTTGAQPSGGLVQGSDGNLYGCAFKGGTHGAGALFKVTTAGVLTAFYSFPGGDENGFTNTGGFGPVTQLTFGTDGNLYGATLQGGTGGYGTLFKATTTGTVTSLHNFAPLDTNQGNSDGANPRAALIRGTDGNFYGAATAGGTGTYGTLFKLTPAGVFTTLHDFSFSNAEGAAPNSTVLQAKDGNFYGLALRGGPGGTGTVYKTTAAGVVSVLHAFTGAADGYEPVGALIQGADGNLYGTTAFGGAHETGTVFKITTAGVLTTLHGFATADSSRTNPDGAYPQSGVVQGADGNFYGTTSSGGPNSTGTIYKITPAGVLTTIHAFAASTDFVTNADGTQISVSLVRGTDGNFYGTTFAGGTGGSGTIFKITAGGTLTTLHQFTQLDSNSINRDGANCSGSLVQGSDGNFYGTAFDGGLNADGTIFKITPAGVFTVLHTFAALDPDDFDTDGANPAAALVLAKDGNFYGTAASGGTGGRGTLYRMTSAGALSVLHSFPALDAKSENTEGATPFAALIQATDGNLYGTLVNGGTHGTGTFYQAVIGSAKPVITSAATAMGTVGTAFAYQIAATGNPATYGESGLPGGLSINQTTGKISGTPTVAGTYAVTIAAFNAAGSGSAKLTLTIKPAPPVITSATTATATVGKAFSYQITAKNSPASYGEAGLPGGLTINQTTGKISGTPTKAGTYTVTVAAFNSGGSGSAKLTLTVKSS